MSTPDPQFMTQLTRVIDRLDDVPQEDGISRRERLLASAQQVCEAQQIPATPVMIAHAVDQELNQVPAVTRTPSETTFDFGWTRPCSQASLDRQTRWLDQGTVFRVLDQLTDLGTEDLIGCGGIAFILAGLSYCLCNINGSIHFGSALLTASIGGLMGWVGLAGAIKWAHRYWRQRTALKEVTVSLDEVAGTWTRHASVRVHVRHCLTSAIPRLLNGDVIRIRSLIELEDTKVQAAQKETQQMHARAALHEALMKLAVD